MYILYRMETPARHVRSQSRFSTGFSALPWQSVSHQAACWGAIVPNAYDEAPWQGISPPFLTGREKSFFLLARTGVRSLSAGETATLDEQIWLRNDLLEKIILSAAPAPGHDCLVEAAFSFLLQEIPMLPLPKKEALGGVQAPPKEDAQPITHMFLLPNVPFWQRLALTLGISKWKRPRAAWSSGSGWRGPQRGPCPAPHNCALPFPLAFNSSERLDSVLLPSLLDSAVIVLFSLDITPNEARTLMTSHYFHGHVCCHHDVIVMGGCPTNIEGATVFFKAASGVQMPWSSSC